MKYTRILSFIALVLVRKTQASVNAPVTVIAETLQPQEATKDTGQTMRPPAHHNRPDTP